LEQAGLTLHGQTTLNGDYPTHAQLEFSRFNLGTLLRMAHVAEFNGESALAGTVSVDGPLARPGSFGVRRSSDNWRSPSPAFNSRATADCTPRCLTAAFISILCT